MPEAVARPGPGKRGVVALVVLVLAVAGIAVAGVLVARDGDGAPGTEWGAIVGVDHESAEVVLFDEQGEELERFGTDFEQLAYAEGRGSYLLVGDDEGSAAILDASDGEPVWEGDRVEDRPYWLGSTTAPVAVIGPPEGGNLTLVHAPTGTAVDVAEEAGIEDPLLNPSSVLISPSGGSAAVADLRGDQSVLVDLEEGTVEATAGWPSAVSDEEVVLIETEDEESTARFVGWDGEEVGSAPLPRAVRGLALTGDSEVVGVGEDDGGVILFRVSDGDDEPTTLADLDVSVDRAIALPEQERIVIGSADGRTILLDTEGGEIASYDGELAPVGIDLHLAECVTITDGDALRVVYVDSGDEVVTGESAAPSYQRSADGCAVGGPGLLLAEGGAVDIDEHDFAVVAPDGRAALVYRGEDGIRLFDLTDADAEPVQIEARSIGGFVER